MGPAIERSGGSAANTIAGLASFGAKCGFIGRVAADQFGGIFRHDIRSLGVAYDTPPADGRRADRALPHLRDARRRAHHEHVSRRERRASPPPTSTRALIEAAKHRLSRRLSVRPRRGQGRLQGGGAACPEVRRQGRPHLSDAFCVDRHRDDFRALIARGRRHRLRQREGDHEPLRGEQLRRGRRRGACRLRARRADPLRGRLGDRRQWRDHRHSRLSPCARWSM